MRPAIATALLCALAAVSANRAPIAPNCADCAEQRRPHLEAQPTAADCADCAEQRARLEAQLYATLADNIRANSRKLRLEDFSWGLFAGARGRLLGLRDYALRRRAADDDGRRLNVEYRLTVPQLRATWERSSCMGYACAMTVELDECEFAVRLAVDGGAGAECAVDHLAYLRRYAGARCHADYDRGSPLAVAWVETTVRLLSYALNTPPFEKIVADNVNHALLRLPLFNATDVRRLCDAYRQLHPPSTALPTAQPFHS